MNIKEQYKGKVITHKDGILGMIKFNLDEITPMQERRLRALGYTHLFEDSVVKNDESHEPVIEETIVEVTEEAKPKRTRKKKAQ